MHVWPIALNTQIKVDGSHGLRAATYEKQVEIGYDQRLNNQSHSKICCGQASQRDVGFCTKMSLCFHSNYYQTIQ